MSYHHHIWKIELHVGLSWLCSGSPPSNVTTCHHNLDETNKFYWSSRHNVMLRPRRTLSFYESKKEKRILLTLHVVGQHCPRRVLNLLISVSRQLHLTPFLKRLYIYLQLEREKTMLRKKKLFKILWIMKIFLEMFRHVQDFCAKNCTLCNSLSVYVERPDMVIIKKYFFTTPNSMLPSPVDCK